MRSITVFVCLLMVFVFLTTFLSACSSGGDSAETASELGTLQDGEEAVGVTQSPSFTPIPTKAPEVAYVDPQYYEYKTEISSNLDAGMYYPSHWIMEKGTSTIAYTQPVNEGEIPARFALTTRTGPGVPGEIKMAELLDDFTAIISRQFADFAQSDILKDREFIKRPAFHRVYTGTLRGVPVKGYIIITCNTRKKRLYVAHFYAPADQYDAMDVVLQKLLDVAVLSR